MKILVVTPIAAEVNCFLHSCTEHGIRSETMVIGKLPVTHFPALGVIVAQGGLGKTQFAVQTQHLIDTCPGLHGDGKQRPLRFSFQLRLMPNVDMTR